MSENITAQAISTRLEEVLGAKGAQGLQVIDESAQHAGHVGANASLSGTHFRVKIASRAFSTSNRVQRHRIVYDAVQDFMEKGLHALAIEVFED